MSSNTTNSRVVIRINGREVEDNLRSIGQEISRVRSQLRQMNSSDPEFRQRSQELRQLRQRYSDINSEINNTGRSLGGLKDILGIVAGVMGIAFSIDMLIQWGQLIFQNTEKVRALKKEISTISGLDGSQLKSATINVGALADTFDVNSSEIAKATNVLSKRMKVPFEEAFAEIKKGFEEGLNYSGDFLEQVREYSPFIKEAGGSIQDMMDIIRSGTVDGVFNDKAIDAVKEGLLSIREMTPATQAALVGLGIDVEEMTKKIESGQMSYWEALQMVSKEMNNTTANSRVMGQVLADVWKGAGEDAGIDYLKGIYKIGNETKNLTQTQKAAIAESERNYSINQKLNASYESLTGASSALNMFWLSMKETFAGVLGLFSDYQGMRLSDDILDEQVSVRMLQNELLEANTTQERRNEIIKELQSLYPGLFSNLNLEKATNAELAKEIDNVNRSLEEKYALQAAQDDVDEAGAIFGDLKKQEASFRNDLRQIISALQTEYKIELPTELKTAEPEKQVVWLRDKITSENKFEFNTKLGGIDRILVEMSALSRETSDANAELQRTKEILAEINNTPAGIRAGVKKLINTVTADINKILDPIANPAKDPNALAKQQEEAKEAKRRAEQARKEAERERKQKADQANRDRDAEVKRREQVVKELLNIEENYRKNLHESNQNIKKDKLDLMADGFEKEKAQLQFEQAEKEYAIREEIRKLEQLEKDYQARSLEETKKKNTDAATQFQDLANRQQNIIASKQETLLSLTKIGENKRLKLVAEYQLKEAELRARENDILLTKHETAQNNEMAKMTSMSEAMKILRQYYSDEELKDVKTLQDAREKLSSQHQKEMLNEQATALQQEINKIAEILSKDAFNSENGLERILTDEAKEKLVANLAQVENALSRVNASLTGEETKDAEEQAAKDEEAKKSMLSGIDLLGFSAEQWTTAFENLDTAGSQMEKLAAAIGIVEMALQTAMNAWGMLADAQNKALDKSLKKYEKNAETKKKALQNQLDKGYFSQEEYNAKIEALEADLEAKRSEIEYRKAMTDWKMNIAQIQIQTALGVMKAVAASPQTGGLPWSAIVGGIGTIQTALAIKNKPKKEGYFDGGLTKGSGEVDAYGRELADGPAHAGEYYVAKRWLSVPDVANAVGYIDDRVNGRSVTSSASSPESTPQPISEPSINPILLARIADVLQKVDETITDFKENPPEVQLSKNWENTKRIKSALDRVESIEKKSIK